MFPGHLLAHRTPLYLADHGHPERIDEADVVGHPKVGDLALKVGDLALVEHADFVAPSRRLIRVFAIPLVRHADHFGLLGGHMLIEKLPDFTR